MLGGQADDLVLTYAALDRRARAIAVRLRDMGLAGQRVLLAYPHGLDFITGFFGCLYAGCTAVPTYIAAPPDGRSFSGHRCERGGSRHHEHGGHGGAVPRHERNGEWEDRGYGADPVARRR